jgi:septal ring factor EnvC (AmiA/AmiB activator)
MRPRLLLLIIAATFVAVPARAADEGTLRDRIHSRRTHERALAGAAAQLGRLERATAREVEILSQRVASAQAALNTAVARQQATAARLAAARARLARLRIRLGQVRARLATVLLARYENGAPDLVTVVLNADGFPQLLETVDFLRRVQHADARLLDEVRTAKADAARERAELIVLERRQRLIAIAVRRRRDALAGIEAGLRARQAALAQARAARLAALHRTRAGRLRAQHELNRLLAARRRAAMASGPGGPWAIPWPIVQCESGGQNLPPNSATASGYYQITDDTWHGLGGTTKHAFQAPKAEQDRRAAALWNGGAGASNWVCAVLVGIV